MKKLLLIFVTLLLIGCLVSLYLAFKPHKNLVNTKSDFVYNVATVIGDFESTTEEEEINFVDKIFEITGTVNNIDVKDSSSIVLFFGADQNIRCEIDPEFIKRVKELKAGDEIVIKGIFSGIAGNEEEEEDDIFAGFGMAKTISFSRCVLLD